MIITITMNPAVDKSVTVEKMYAEKKLRCENLLMEAGGGGLNISKALKELSGESLAIFPSGSSNGKWLEKNLSERDIKFRTFAVANETRVNFTVTDNSNNAQYRFVMPGCALTGDEVKLAIDTILGSLKSSDIIVASGSLPIGVANDFFAGLAASIKNVGSKFIIDTSGKPLQLAAKEGVYLLKPNLGELSALVGSEYLKPDEVERAANEIIEKGQCEIVVVSMGALGAMLVTKGTTEMVSAPLVQKKSTIGAGDSMVAGILFMLEQGKSVSEMIRFGVACGTAATMNAGSQLFHKAEVYKLYEGINKSKESVSKKGVA